MKSFEWVAARAALLWLVLSCLADQAVGDWPRFRGVNGSGLGSGSPPVTFGPQENLLWRVPVGEGHSSPCIVADSIFLTTSSPAKKQLSVLCLDRTNGATKWETNLSVEAFEKGHPAFNPASSTPVSDGQRVVAYFGSYGLVCLDMQGNPLWEIKLPMAKSFGGNATSPIIAGDRVILYRGTYVDHFVVAVDKRTGEELWRVDQDEPINAEMACTSVPIVAGEKLILHSARSVQAVDIRSGKQLWVTKCGTTATSSPVLAGDEVIVAAWNQMGEPALRPKFPTFDSLLADHDRDRDGVISPTEFPPLWIFHRPEGVEAPMNGAKIRFRRTDRNRDEQITRSEWQAQLETLERFRAGYERHGLLAIPLTSQGVVEKSNVRTLEQVGIPEVPSPLCDGRYLYSVKNGGVLSCLELKTGKRMYRMRTGGKGTHYASPVMADGRIYTAAGDGLISVIQGGSDPKVLATNRLDDEVYATPAIVNGTIYVRTHSAMFAFRNQ